MSKKTQQKKAKPSRLMMVRNTLQNKISRLETILRKHPTDISADIALGQARYDLKMSA